jgi:hypothetical protein
LLMLVGSGMCFVFNQLVQRRLKAQGSIILQQLHQKNYLALLFQGVLLVLTGGITLFVKWWAAIFVMTLAGPLFFYFALRGWPHFQIRDPKSEIKIQKG